MTNNEKMWDLGIEVQDDGQINLEQDSGCGEMVRITLHPVQIRLLAERSGLLNSPTGPIGYGLMVRQLAAIRDRANGLYELLASVPSFPPSEEEDEDVMRARKLYEALDRLCAVEINRESTTQRRFKAVVERLNALSGNPVYLDEILERCGSGSEYITERSALCELANEYLNDLELEAGME